MKPKEPFPSDTSAFIRQIRSALRTYSSRQPIFPETVGETEDASAVLFLLGPTCGPSGNSIEPCVILNKRSERVRQPGDLCCPGGGITARLDPLLAKTLRVPGTPLSRWPDWKRWRAHRQPEARVMATLLAAALRESFEEMRLNPLGVTFLGPLPPQQLVMFKRTIYPMVCWIQRQKRFFPNWEVEKLIYIPVRDLLNPSRYARCRLESETVRKSWNHSRVKDFTCFLHDGAERLWGATFRITMAFLELVFGFEPPGGDRLPIVHGKLVDNYKTGRR